LLCVNSGRLKESFDGKQLGFYGAGSQSGYLTETPQ